MWFSTPALALPSDMVRGATQRRAVAEQHTPQAEAAVPTLKPRATRQASYLFISIVPRAGCPGCIPASTALAAASSRGLADAVGGQGGRTSPEWDHAAEGGDLEERKERRRRRLKELYKELSSLEVEETSIRQS